MKSKKTVTDAVVQANRENGKKNRTGPKDTKNTRYNAQKGGFLARKIPFRDEAERKEFDELVNSLGRAHRISGESESNLVCEMAISLWRLRDLYAWEWREMLRREETSTSILQAVRNTGDPLELPLPGATPDGWEPSEITVKGGTGSRETETPLGGDKTGKTTQTIVEAKVISPLHLILRYGASIRRDYYRALAALLQVQRSPG